MNDGNISDNFDHETSRRWRCPGCDQVFRIPEDEGDPTLCSVCENEAELDIERNRKKCQHCGEPHEVDEDVIEIDFKCQQCGKRTVWRQPGLVIHHLEDEETFQRLKPILVLLGIIFGLLILYVIAKDFYGFAQDFDIREISLNQFLTLIVIIAGLVRIFFFNQRKCESCQETKAMEWVATSRLPRLVIRHLYRCQSCGFKIAEDTYGSGQSSRTERVYAGYAPDFRCYNVP